MTQTNPPAPVPIYGDISSDSPLDVTVHNFPATQPVSGTVSVANLPATQPISGAVSVSNLPAIQSVSGTVTGSPFQSSAFVYTHTNVLTSSVLVAAANPSRKGIIIFNNSSNSVYVSFNSPAVSSNCVRLIATFASWESLGPVCYTGAIYAIRNAGTGELSVFELV